MRQLLIFLLLLMPACCCAQYPRTPFELSGGRRCATYTESRDFFRALDSASASVRIVETGPTDAGLPLQVVYYTPPAGTAPALRILINNSIHPGEPDGTDACMLLLRDVVAGKVQLPANVALAIIPVYNIGGALNRGSHSRVNQAGPEAYGFRGNAQNLDLNRDFTKCDSREAALFAQVFQHLDPDVFIDNHVSDGADYQHTMTLLSTQYDKLGPGLGAYMRDSLDPAIYRHMRAAGWPMIPYVNFEESDPRRGWTAFYDPPRFSAGYAALFHTIAYTPETHMLKPFRQRVAATYALLLAIIRESAARAGAIRQARAAAAQYVLQAAWWPLSWRADTTRAAYYTFLGYEAGARPSEVTGASRLYYDHTRPFTARIPIHDRYRPADTVRIPAAYIIPQGWHKVIDRLKGQGVPVQVFPADTLIGVTAYYIDDYKTSAKAYEGHYKHYDVQVRPVAQRLRFRQGDCIIYTTDPRYRRFIVEVLEPAGDDAYFAWNFFDAVLQQKEGYSDYRWEDIAARYLKAHPELKQALAAKRQADPAFARDAAAQLRYVYQHSPWYEPEHLRYPVFRLEPG